MNKFTETWLRKLPYMIHLIEEENDGNALCELFDRNYERIGQTFCMFLHELKDNDIVFGNGDKVYFYTDPTAPWVSEKMLAAYTEKLNKLGSVEI